MKKAVKEVGPGVNTVELLKVCDILCYMSCDFLLYVLSGTSQVMSSICPVETVWLFAS